MVWLRRLPLSDYAFKIKNDDHDDDVNGVNDVDVVDDDADDANGGLARIWLKNMAAVSALCEAV